MYTHILIRNEEEGSLWNSSWTLVFFVKQFRGNWFSTTECKCGNKCSVMSLQKQHRLPNKEHAFHIEILHYNC